MTCSLYRIILFPRETVKFIHERKYFTKTKSYAYRILVGKPEGKRPLGRPRRRWVDNIKMDLGEIGWDGRDWIKLAQDRDQWRALVNTAIKLRVL
jgi:hypothetical protein